MLKGQIILKSNDTLKGYLRVNPDYKGCAFLETGKFTGIYIPSKKIESIRLDVASLGRDFTEIVTLKSVDHPRNRFWRLVKKKGAISIYDISTGVFSDRPWKELRSADISRNEFNSHMIMIIKGNPIKIYGSLYGLFVAKNRSKNFILKFINKRYGTSLKESDFKTGMEMIDYILDKENEKETLENKQK